MQVSERIQHQTSFPFNREVRHILDRFIILLEDVGLQFWIWFTYKLGETLIPTTLIHGEDQEGSVVAMLPVECLL